MMNDERWEEFFDLMTDIVNEGGSWQEKKQEVLNQARDNCADGALEEFLGWFRDEE